MLAEALAKMGLHQSNIQTIKVHQRVMRALLDYPTTI